ncbi:UNVERIFIED_CONTAM: hypothetical protein Sradi_5083300 [Sesamum radiatum]|uniref:GAG-pre-integrase domain-containing protein n=1 Tax=Sesamum radiatum TaxID=300843 RepID=A0AAW2M103_SESRA
MTIQHKRKFDNHENAQLWHARLGHISKDRIRKLVDSKSLEIDDLVNLPTCESCLKGKMTKKPFVGQSAHQQPIKFDPYRCLWTIKYSGKRRILIVHNLHDDHSRYGYACLMRYKSEAFGRLKEYRLEVENQTGHKIKTLRSD